VALLTPVVKAFLTDIGHRGADDALGVLGGYGYIHEYGIEQQVRDSRIAMIYEGTNEVQAIDLVMRKLLGRGRGFSLLLQEFQSTVKHCQAASLVGTGDAVSTLKRIADSLQAQSQEAELAVAHLAAARDEAAEAPYKVADDMLHAMGHALLCWSWARIAIAGMKQPPSEVQEHRLATCAFGVDWVLPAAQWRWTRIANWRVHLPWLVG